MDATTPKPKKIRKRHLQRNDNDIREKKAKLEDSTTEEIEKNDTTEATSNHVEDNTQTQVICNESQTDFNGKSLRTLFTASNGINVLKKFVMICNENKERDLASEYLLAGGNVLEILRLLDTIDKKNNSNASTVFSAINILLMRILAQYPQYQNSAVEACRHLLNSHMSIVHSMLSIQSNARQRKIILKLLAAIVSLGGNLSRELLAHLSLQQQILDDLARHTKPTDHQSVRTHFIHFLLAFLVEGNTPMIKTLLDKRGLLSCIFPDLMYDSKDIVNLVLTTVRTYVLENTSISKTTKMHVFSTSVVLNLVSLYNWKGPSNWPKNKTRSSTDSEEFKADKEVVNDTVHEFLVVLLTSHRYGLIFHDRTLGISGNKHNQLVYTVLRSLEKPWEHERPSDLVIKIMEACPDLIRSQYGVVEPSLEPRSSAKWIALVRFVEKIIKSVNPEICIKNCLSEISVNSLIGALLSLIAPITILKNAIIPGLNHESLLVRHEALTLLLTIIKQLKTISLCTKIFDKMHVTQNQIMDFILRTVPNLESILKTWNLAFQTEIDNTITENSENVPIPSLFDHLDLTLNVLHVYNDICPELLDNSMDVDPIVLLSHLDSLQNDDDNNINSIKIKAIQFLLVLDSSIFMYGKKAFKKALLFLITLICQKNDCISTRNTINTLLNATGLFEACSDQLDIWLDGFSVVTDSDEKQELMHWFMSILKSAIKHNDKYINSIIEAEGTISEQMADFDVKKAKDMINELFDEANNKTSNSYDKKVEYMINGQPIVTDTKEMYNIIDDSINKSEKKNFKNGIICTDNTTQVIDIDVKKAERIINGTIKKIADVNSYSFHKDFSTILAVLINKAQPVELDTEESSEVIDDSFSKLQADNFDSYRMQPSTSMSPLLCCALQKYHNENSPTAISSYLSYVIVHILHYQVAPGLLIHMTKDLTSLPVHKYLQAWSNNNQPVQLKSKLPSFRLFCKLSNALLLDTEMEITKILDGDITYCFKYDDHEITIKHSLSQRNITALLKMIVFYLAQLAQRKSLKPIQNENFKLALVLLLNIAQSIDSKNLTIVEENAKCIFTHPIMLHYFSPLLGKNGKNSTESMITMTILEICKTVTQLQKRHNNARISNIFFAFRNKFLMQLQHAIEKNPLEICKNNYDVAIVLLEILQLRMEDITNMLLMLTKLEKTMFISSNKQNLSMFGYIIPILLDMSCSKKSRLAHVQNDVLNEQFIAKLSLYLVYLKSTKINDVPKWEIAFSRYLSIYPRNIAGISTDTFALLLTKGISESTIQLITILITKNTKLIPSLVKYFLKLENVKQGNVIFPILQSNLQYKWNDKFLQSLYKCYSDDIVKYLTEPRDPVSWIEENISAIGYLIENTFDLVLCEKTSDNIAQSGDKLDMVSIRYIQLFESLYKRYEYLAKIKEKPLTDLIKILLHVITSTLKKESKNLEKINVLCEKLDNTVICLTKDKRDFVFSSLNKSYSWPQFTRFSLKMGLKDAKNDIIQHKILKTLCNLCDIAYEDNIDNDYAKTLFEMTTSHSEFVNVILGSSIVKGALVELLWVLTRKIDSVMTATHIPLYLAAYNATLSETDQRILRIIQHYEVHNIKIQQYWPYFWGNTAGIRYGVKAEIDTALWRQPATSEIFNLFDKDIVNETITNYPVYRTLKNDQLHENSDVYDPAFYLPLLCCLLAENNIVSCHRVTQSGALALAFAACGSNSSDVRMTAYTVISRYYFHLEASRSKEKLLWMRLIDALRNGVISLKCPLKSVRLNCLVSTFLARASLVATQPLHPLYSPLHTFLMAKPALDVNTIPELLQLLHSSHVEHKAHRHWILENIRDGIKIENDVDVAMKCVLFKMLFGFHACLLADIKTKILILEIIASATRISKASLRLLRGYGLLPWLYEIVSCAEINEAKVIDVIITIIENLLNNLDNLTEDTMQYRLLLFNIFSQLQTHIPRNVTNKLYIRHVNIVQRIINTKNIKNFVSERNIQEILDTVLSQNT